MTATFKARIKGDLHWDEVSAETPLQAAEKFAAFLYHEERGTMQSWSRSPTRATAWSESSTCSRLT